MKIDTHQHYWHYQSQEFPWISEAMPLLQRDCLPADCESARRAAGVNAVVAVQARTLPEETTFLLQLADQQPDVVGVVGWADLLAPGVQGLAPYSARRGRCGRLGECARREPQHAGVAATQVGV
jgi:L-fuconolactonase